MERRDVKEMAVAREKVYAELIRSMDMASIGYAEVGMSKEGFIVKDVETGLFAQIKVVAKGLDFDAEDALIEYEEAKVRAIEKKIKHDEKVVKEKAKKEKEKAEKEVENAKNEQKFK